MGNPEKSTEPFLQTVIRTIITTTIIAIILVGLHLFPSGGLSKLTLSAMIWLMVFCVVFGGHWLELMFINRIKFALPENIFVGYGVRIAYWYLYSIPLFFVMNLVENLFAYHAGHLGSWAVFGFLYIGIQLFMHAIMQIRFKKSFYNGVY